MSKNYDIVYDNDRKGYHVAFRRGASNSHAWTVFIPENAQWTDIDDITRSLRWTETEFVLPNRIGGILKSLLAHLNACEGAATIDLLRKTCNSHGGFESGSYYRFDYSSDGTGWHLATNGFLMRHLYAPDVQDQHPTEIQSRAWDKLAVLKDKMGPIMGPFGEAEDLALTVREDLKRLTKNKDDIVVVSFQGNWLAYRNLITKEEDTRGYACPIIDGWFNAELVLSALEGMEGPLEMAQVRLPGNVNLAYFRADDHEVFIMPMDLKGWGK